MMTEVTQKRCASCGALNNIRPFSDKQIPKCGKCGQKFDEKRVTGVEVNYRIETPPDEPLPSFTCDSCNRYLKKAFKEGEPNVCPHCGGKLTWIFKPHYSTKKEKIIDDFKWGLFWLFIAAVIIVNLANCGGGGIGRYNLP